MAERRGGVVSEERRLIVDNMTARRQSPWTMPAQREERQERPKQQEAAPTDLLQKIYRAVRNGLRTDRGKAYFAVQARKNGYTEESANPTAIESAETISALVYRGADERDEESRFDRILTPTKTLLNYFLNEGRKDPKYFDKLIEDLVYRQMTRTARNAAVELNRWDTAKEISQRLGEMNWLLDAADSRGEFVEARKIAQAIRLNREPVIYEVALEFLKPNNRERILAHANRILKQQTQTPVASQS